MSRLNGKKQKKKVLHLLTSVSAGGIETWLLNIFRELGTEMYEQHVLCRSQQTGLFADKFKEVGVQIHTNQYGRFSFPELVWRIRSLHKTHHFDLIHNHLSIHAVWGSIAQSKLVCLN